MDPLTQGLLGASLPQSAARKSEQLIAGVLGFLAGMAADLDVLIRSANDPLLFLEYHRQFTHSLIFIPVGGLVCALVLYLPLVKRRGLTFRRCLAYCTLGYATHALLDACTTYGTMLFWPFSDARIAWNTISIIDPAFTGPILALVLLAAFRKRVLFARMALIWAVGYMSLGLWQRNAAIEMGQEIAAQRGHSPLRLEAKPSFANILVWKVVYETAERFYVDAVRASLAPRVFPGSSISKLDIDRDLAWLNKDSQQAKDIERFRWFSNGYIARDPQNHNKVIDIRYSLVPNTLAPLWSIELNRAAGSTDHAAYRTHRETTGQESAIIWQMITGW